MGPVWWGSPRRTQLVSNTRITQGLTLTQHGLACRNLVATSCERVVHTKSLPACVRPVQLLPGGGGAHLPSAVGHGRDRPVGVRVHPGPGTGAGLGDRGEHRGGDQEDQGEQWNCWRIYWRLHTEHTWGLVLLWSWLCSWYSLCGS